MPGHIDKTGHYKRSKFLAEQVVRHLTNKHKLPLVIVNPSTPIGPRDIRPTPTGQIVLDTLCGRMPAYMNTGLNIAHVDDKNNKIVDYAGVEIDYDLLVTVPTNMGDAMIERSGFGDELNYVPTDKATLQTNVKDNIFAIGDATNIPASKAGSVAHFEAEILTENILRYIDGKFIF